MGGILGTSESSKQSATTSKLEAKMVEAMQKRARKGTSMRSFNNIILKFPKIDESLRKCNTIFEEFDDGFLDLLKTLSSLTTSPNFSVKHGCMLALSSVAMYNPSMICDSPLFPSLIDSLKNALKDDKFPVYETATSAVGRLLIYQVQNESNSKTSLELLQVLVLALQDESSEVRMRSLSSVKAIAKADDIRNEANELLRIRDYLFGELAKKTGQHVEKVEATRLCEKDGQIAHTALDLPVFCQSIDDPLLTKPAFDDIEACYKN